MKSTGMIRSVDQMGRVVIPREIRKQLKIENGLDSFEIYMDGNRIILEKFEPTCTFCGSLSDSVMLNGHVVCASCIEKLYSMKDTAE